MPIIKPFQALRPRPDLAEKICELPYDVMSSKEAALMAKDNPYSFLRVSKPEIDLDPAVDHYDPRVYAKGRENFLRMRERGWLQQDAIPRLYLYRQVMGHHSQTGLVAVVSCEEYEKGIIKKHELTRPDKEDDRVRHIEALESQTGPVFLTYPAQEDLDRWVSARTFDVPAIDFTSSDGVRHTSWVVEDPKDEKFLMERFASLPAFYIADGHHRSAAAGRVWKKHGNPAQSSPAYFLAVIFPHNQMQIMPYNRVVRDLNGLGLDRFIQSMRELGRLEIHHQPKPARKHEISIFLDGVWNVFRWKTELHENVSAIDQLDVSLLQKHVLGPLLGVDDPRTSQRIQFVGGIRGTEELERLVRDGDWEVAFSMHPTDIRDLMSIADQGGIMPPKSTWFEPKLRDAMFCHLIGV